MIRAAISGFIVVVIGLAISGWLWTTGHQTRVQARASHVVLALAILAGLIGLKALWWRPEGARR